MWDKPCMPPLGKDSHDEGEEAAGPSTDDTEENTKEETTTHFHLRLLTLTAPAGGNRGLGTRQRDDLEHIREARGVDHGPCHRTPTFFFPPLSLTKKCPPQAMVVCAIVTFFICVSGVVCVVEAPLPLIPAHSHTRLSSSSDLQTIPKWKDETDMW